MTRANDAFFFIIIIIILLCAKGGGDFWPRRKNLASPRLLRPGILQHGRARMRQMSCSPVPTHTTTWHDNFAEYVRKSKTTICDARISLSTMLLPGTCCYYYVQSSRATTQGPTAPQRGDPRLNPT